MAQLAYVTYTNAKHEDQGILKAATFDFAFGDDENSFSVTLDRRSNTYIESYGYVYIEGTEYGGMVTESYTDTSSEEQSLVYSGYTWHGMLNTKIIGADSGDDYWSVSGEANACIGKIIDRLGIDELFIASDEDSGIQVSYDFRYVEAYTGLRAMLGGSSARLHMVYDGTHVVMSAKPITDYTTTQALDTDLITLQLTKDFLPVNHLICLGEGEMEERTIIHLYADSNGNVSEKQTLFGIYENALIYDYNNVEYDELYDAGVKKLEELQVTDSSTTNLLDDKDYYVDDIVGAYDIDTGEMITVPILKKIVSIDYHGLLNIEYQAGTPASDTLSITGGTSSSNSGKTYVAGKNISIVGYTISSDVGTEDLEALQDGINTNTSAINQIRTDTNNSISEIESDVDNLKSETNESLASMQEELDNLPDYPLSTELGGTGNTKGHIDIAQGTNTTSSVSPSHGDSFTAIDSITRDEFSHVTKYNTKTITLPETKEFAATQNTSNTLYPLAIKSNDKNTPYYDSDITINDGTLTDNLTINTTGSYCFECNDSTTNINIGSGESYVDCFSLTLSNNSISQPMTFDVAVCDRSGKGTVNQGRITLKFKQSSTTSDEVESFTHTGYLSAAIANTDTDNRVWDVYIRRMGNSYDRILVSNIHIGKYMRDRVTLKVVDTAVTSLPSNAINATNEILSIDHGGTGTTTGHIPITQSTNTTSSVSPAHGESFTAIDSITRDDYSHVTKYNTKTITLPETKELTTTEDTTNTLYAAGIKDGDTGTIRYDSDVTIKDGTLTDNVTINKYGSYCLPSSNQTTTGTSSSWYDVLKITIKLDSIGDPIIFDVGQSNRTANDTELRSSILKLMFQEQITATNQSVRVFTYTGSIIAAVAPENEDKTIWHLYIQRKKTVYDRPSIYQIKIGRYLRDRISIEEVNDIVSTLPDGAVYATPEILSIDHGGTGTTTGHIPITQSTNTTSSVSPAHGESFTAIDSITRDEFSHVTKYNTKTITLPAATTPTTKEDTSSTLYPLGFTSSDKSTLRYDTGVNFVNGTMNGNASTATKLATARTIRTNLASTSTASFDGSANITPGVTGTLPIANGGTGVTTGHIAIANAGNISFDSDLNVNYNEAWGYSRLEGIDVDTYGHVTGINYQTINFPSIPSKNYAWTVTTGATQTGEYTSSTTSGKIEDFKLYAQAGLVVNGNYSDYTDFFTLTNDGALTIKTAGWWEISGNVGFGYISGSTVRCAFWIDGYCGNVVLPTSIGSCVVSPFTVHYDAGDYGYLQWFTSTSDNVRVYYTDQYTWLNLKYLGE